MFQKWRVHGIIIASLLIFTLSLTGCLGGGKGAAFKVQGVQDQETYGRPITPIVTPVAGSTLKQLTLNDKAYENGTPIVASGSYRLGIVVENAQGKTVVDEITFTLRIHTFRVSEDLKGFSPRNSSLAHNSDEDFTLQNGSLGNIKVSPIENEWNYYPRVLVNSDHDDWETDWTIYDTISVWIYLSDLESLDENGIRIGCFGNITETYFGPANSLSFYKEDMVVGWNNFQVNLEELLVFESFWESEQHSISFGDIIDRRGELENFVSTLFIDVITSEAFYVSDIQLLKK